MVDERRLEQVWLGICRWSFLQVDVRALGKQKSTEKSRPSSPTLTTEQQHLREEWRTQRKNWGKSQDQDRLEGWKRRLHLLIGRASKICSILAILEHSWELHFHFNPYQLDDIWTLPGPRWKAHSQNLASSSYVLRAHEIHTLSQVSPVLHTCLVVN